MLKLLFPLIAGISWAWRGWSEPKCIHGYWRGLVTSFVIVGMYCLCTPTMSVFTLQGLFAVFSLALLEGMLGYGETCEDIDKEYIGRVELNLTSLFNNSPVKERYAYLGFVGLAYYLFPYMILNPHKPIWVYILIAVLGFRIFPLNKLAQLKSYNTIVGTQVITIPIIKRDINIPQNLCCLFSDPWKMVEFGVGMGFGIWLMGIL